MDGAGRHPFAAMIGIVLALLGAPSERAGHPRCASRIQQRVGARRMAGLCRDLCRSALFAINAD